MARLNGYNIFHSVSAIFGALAFVCSFQAEASCVRQLLVAHEMREEALQKVSSNAADAHTKVWLAYVETTKFEKSVKFIDHFSNLIMDSNNQATPAFLRMLKHPLGRSALSKISGLDVKQQLKINGTKGLAEFILNGAIFRVFYFVEHEAVIPSQKVFEQLTLELHQFAYRMELLKNLDLNVEKASYDVYEKHLKRYFHSFVHKDKFNEAFLPHERVLKTDTDDLLLEAKPNDFDVSTQPLLDLNVLIYTYKELMPPAFTRYRPLDKMWEFFVNRRRKKYFSYYERELRVLLAAVSNSEGDMKAFYATDFFKSLEAFQIQFLVMAAPEQKHLFRVNMTHHFPFLLKALARDSHGAIDGDLISPKTYELIGHWCEKLGIEAPPYVYGNQLTDPE